MHVLESMDTMEPPIKILSYQECFKRIWLDPGSLRENIETVLQKIEPCPMH